MSASGLAIMARRMAWAERSSRRGPCASPPAMLPRPPRRSARKSPRPRRRARAITRIALSIAPCPLPRRAGWVRSSTASRSARLPRNSGGSALASRLSRPAQPPDHGPGVTRVTARCFAQPPKAAFVTRLRPGKVAQPSRSSATGSIDNSLGGASLHWLCGLGAHGILPQAPGTQRLFGASFPQSGRIPSEFAAPQGISPRAGAFGRTRPGAMPPWPSASAAPAGPVSALASPAPGRRSRRRVPRASPSSLRRAPQRRQSSRRAGSSA